MALQGNLTKISYLPKLELEIAFSVEDLDAVVVGVSHHDLVVGSHRHPARLGELPSEDAKLAKLAVIDHLLTLDVRLWGIDDGWRWHWGGDMGDEVRRAGGEEIAHAKQVIGVGGHVVVLQVVEVVESQRLVSSSSLQVTVRIHSIRDETNNTSKKITWSGATWFIEDGGRQIGGCFPTVPAWPTSAPDLT